MDFVERLNEIAYRVLAVNLSNDRYSAKVELLYKKDETKFLYKIRKLTIDGRQYTKREIENGSNRKIRYFTKELAKIITEKYEEIISLTKK